TDDPGQPDLANERRRGRRRHTGGRRGDRGGHREVAGRVVEPGTPRDGPEDVGAPESETGAVEHRPDQLEPAEIETARLSAGRPLAPSDEPLDLTPEPTPPAPSDERPALDREPTPAGQREGRGGAGLAPAREQELARVDLAQPRPGHLEPGHLALGPEPVLAGREHSEPRTRIAVERQNDVDGVLERSGAGEVPVFGDVAGHQDRDAPRPWRTPPARPRT